MDWTMADSITTIFSSGNQRWVAAAPSNLNNI